MKIYSNLPRTHKKLPVFEGLDVHPCSLTGFFDRFFVRPMFKGYETNPVRFYTDFQFEEILKDVEAELHHSVDRAKLCQKAYSSNNDYMDDWENKKWYVLGYVKNNIEICRKATNCMIYNKIIKLKLYEIEYPTENCYITDLPYGEYLKTDHWQRIKSLSMDRDGKKCVLCSSEDNLHGHHRDYKKKGNQSEFKDVYILCKRCHEAYHKIIKEGSEDLEFNQIKCI